MESLQNHLLVAMPHLTDPSFNKSVIYICDNSPRGTMGLVVNRPMTSANVALILNALGMDSGDQPSPLKEIYYGGPVQPGIGFVLHSSDYGREVSNRISDDLALSTNLDVLEDIRKGVGPDHYRRSLGYAGWGEDQVEREIANGDWLVIPATAEFVFNKPDTKKWEQAARRFGIEIAEMGGQGGEA